MASFTNKVILFIAVSVTMAACGSAGTSSALVDVRSTAIKISLASGGPALTLVGDGSDTPDVTCGINGSDGGEIHVAGAVDGGPGVGAFNSFQIVITMHHVFLLPAGTIQPSQPFPFTNGAAGMGGGSSIQYSEGDGVVSFDANGGAEISVKSMSWMTNGASIGQKDPTTITGTVACDPRGGVVSTVAPNRLTTEPPISYSTFGAGGGNP